MGLMALAIPHRLDGPGHHHGGTEGTAEGGQWKRPSHWCRDLQGGEGAQRGGQSLHLQAVLLSKPSHQLWSVWKQLRSPFQQQPGQGR